MKTNEVIQVLLYFGLLIGLTPLLGGFMARVFEGKRTFLSGVLGPVENWSIGLAAWTRTRKCRGSDISSPC